MALKDSFVTLFNEMELIDSIVSTQGFAKKKMKKITTVASYSPCTSCIMPPDVIISGWIVCELFCLVLRHYTVRYREKNRKWNYQTCPTSDTVIDKLKPNTVYEFGVQPNSKDGTGVWSRPVVHNISVPGVEGKFDFFA